MNDLGDLHDELYAASEIAVKLLCEASRRPGDDYDLAAMRLGNAADLLPAKAVGITPTPQTWTIEEIHAEMKADRPITPSMAIQYAQHHMREAVAREREACAKVAELIGVQQYEIYSERDPVSVGDDIAKEIRNRAQG